MLYRKNLFKNFLTDRVFFCIFVLTLCLEIFWRYSGNNHDFYIDVYQFILNPGSYANDLYLQNSMVFDSSVFYKIVEVFRYNPDNDYVGLIAHFFLSGISLLSVYCLIKEAFTKDRYVIFALMLVLIYFHMYVLMPGSPKSGIISSHTNTPTHIAHQLSFPFLLFIYRRRFLTANLILTVILSMTLKAHWLLLPFGMLFVLFDKDAKKINLLYFCIPAVYVISKLFFMHGAMTSFSGHDMLQMCGNILERDKGEDAFQYHRKLNQSLLNYGLSFLIFYAFMPGSERRTSAFLKSIFYISLGVFVVGGYYAWKGYLDFPNPALILLSPVRSMKFFIFFFYLLFWLKIFESPLNPLLKIACPFLFLHYIDLKGEPALAVRILFVVLCVIFFFPYVEMFFRRIFQKERGESMELMPHHGFFSTREPSKQKDSGCLGGNRPLKVIILCFFLLSIFNASKRAFQLCKNHFFPFHKWSYLEVAPDKELLDILLELRKDPEDYILIAVIQPAHKKGGGRGLKNIGYNGKANFTAMKSRYLADRAHFYLNPGLYEEDSRRKEYLQNFISDIKEGVRPDMDFIQGYPARILLPKEAEGLFPQSMLVKSYKHYILINPDERLDWSPSRND